MAEDDVSIEEQQFGERTRNMPFKERTQCLLVEQHALASHVDGVLDFGFVIVKDQLHRIVWNVGQLQLFDGVQIVHQHLL